MIDYDKINQDLKENSKQNEKYVEGLSRAQVLYAMARTEKIFKTIYSEWKKLLDNIPFLIPLPNEVYVKNEEIIKYCSLISNRVNLLKTRYKNQRIVLTQNTGNSQTDNVNLVDFITLLVKDLKIDDETASEVLLKPFDKVKSVDDIIITEEDYVETIPNVNEDVAPIKKREDILKENKFKDTISQKTKKIKPTKTIKTGLNTENSEMLGLDDYDSEDENSSESQDSDEIDVIESDFLLS